MEPPTWRRVEAALIAVGRSFGFVLHPYRDSGDQWATPDDSEINLTEFAKDLARELETT